MMELFTRREKHVLIVFAVTLLGIFLSGVEQQTLEEYSWAWILFVVLPVGFYIMNDPERRKVD